LELSSEIFNQFCLNLSFSLGIPLLILLLAGFSLAFLQAITQIQDQVLTFVPKTAILCALVVYGGSASIHMLVDFLVQVLKNIKTI